MVLKKDTFFNEFFILFIFCGHIFLTTYQTCMFTNQMLSSRIAFEFSLKIGYIIILNTNNNFTLN